MKSSRPCARLDCPVILRHVDRLDLDGRSPLFLYPQLVCRFWRYINASILDIRTAIPDLDHIAIPVFQVRDLGRSAEASCSRPHWIVDSCAFHRPFFSCRTSGHSTKPCLCAPCRSGRDRVHARLSPRTGDVDGPLYVRQTPWRGRTTTSDQPGCEATGGFRRVESSDDNISLATPP